MGKFLKNSQKIVIEESPGLFIHQKHFWTVVSNAVQIQ